MNNKIVKQAVCFLRIKRNCFYHIMNNLKWNIRRTKKILLNEKINIVFVCHRPNIWGSLKTIFEACSNDEQFNVTIVAIPNKKQLSGSGLAHEIYESEGAEEFFKNFPCKVINGYDYQTKKWFDLKSLKPDYLFFQQPYNITRTKQYQSHKIAKYTKLLYVHYAANFIGNGVFESTYPRDFIKDLNCIFMQDINDKKLVEKHIKEINPKIKTILSGFPRYDEITQLINTDSPNWNLPRTKEIKRIIWTPRWSTTEGNCHFFDYKDFLIEYAEENKDIDFIFRPHPQMFLELAATGELPADKAEEYKKRYDSCNNAKIDTQKEYLTTFYSSDILITDISSIVAEYFLTGKPVIYCHRVNHFNEFSAKIAEGFYWVHNWNELKQTIEMLKSGEDPLYEKRQQIIKDNFYINPDGAGYTIKEIIKKDFYGKN